MSCAPLLALAALGLTLIAGSGWLAAWRLMDDARRGRRARRAERKYRAKMRARPACFGELMLSHLYGERGCEDCGVQDACRARTRQIHAPQGAAAQAKRSAGGGA